MSFYNFKYRDLHGALIKVGRFVFHNFDGDDFHCLHVLTLYHLGKGSLAENIQNKVLVALIDAEDVIDVEDVVAVLVVETIVFDSFARFGQTPSWIP